MKRTASIVAACLLIGGLSAVSSPAFAGPSASNGGSSAPGYNAIPSSVKGNVPSVGFQATQTTEFGDQVALSGTNRTLSTMTVLFSSWACQSGAWESGDCATTPGATFNVPITFTIYDSSTMTSLATKTQTVAVAYRPSASNQCVGAADAGKWYNPSDKTCYNGFPQAITMAMDRTPLTDTVIWSVKYPTYNTNGGVSGPADSLNVGVFSFPNAPYSGTDLIADAVFRNGAMENGWTGYRPLGAITTVK
jgi:hypothetical protein